jgi:20S proteasome alpha/beta subunit
MRKNKNYVKFEKLGSYTANMRRKQANVRKNSLMERLDPDAVKYAETCVSHIWQNIEAGNIDLGYAVAGYDLHTGEPIYEYDLLVTLLSSYGYSAGVSALFIDEFMRAGSDGDRNVVVSSSRKAEIFKNVHSLPDNPCAENNNIIS